MTRSKHRRVWYITRCNLQAIHRPGRNYVETSIFTACLYVMIVPFCNICRWMDVHVLCYLFGRKYYRGYHIESWRQCITYTYFHLFLWWCDATGGNRRPIGRHLGGKLKIVILKIDINQIMTDLTMAFAFHKCYHSTYNAAYQKWYCDL